MSAEKIKPVPPIFQLINKFKTHVFYCRLFFARLYGLQLIFIFLKLNRLYLFSYTRTYNTVTFPYCISYFRTILAYATISGKISVKFASFVTKLFACYHSFLRTAIFGHNLKNHFVHNTPVLLHINNYTTSTILFIEICNAIPEFKNTCVYTEKQYILHNTY